MPSHEHEPQQEQDQRIFLHVGSPKTGTTFLQNVLWSQRDRAKEQGLLLPLTSLRDHYMATLDARDITEHAPDPRRAKGLWGAAATEALAWPGTVLISHELLAGATREQAERALGAFGPDVEIHVVVTARDYVRQIPAEWQEHVKHRNTFTYREFLDQIEGDVDGRTWFWRVQDFASVLRRWGADLPPNRVHLVTVPPPGATGDLLWGRFSTLLRLDAGLFDLERARSNTSLGAEQTELLRRLNLVLGDRLPLRGPYPAAVKGALAHQVLSTRRGTPFGLVGSDLDYAVRRSQELVEDLTAMGVDVVGDLADLVPEAVRSDRGANADPDALPESALLQESLEALVSLIERHVAAGPSSVGAQRRRRVADLEAQVQALVAERDALVRGRRERPVRQLLVGLSERWPWLTKVRSAYRKLVRA